MATSPAQTPVRGRGTSQPRTLRHRGRSHKPPLPQSRKPAPSPAAAERILDPAASPACSPARIVRYLPLALLTTAAVTVLPGVLVESIVAARGLLAVACSAAIVVALSIAIAGAAAAGWKRMPGSRDVVFAELMLWGWSRRYWTERRLSHTRALYESARRAGPNVSIELVQRLSRLLEARDPETHGHSQRVARHAGRIARAIHLPAGEVAKIQTAASVHDVGKLHTPPDILHKAGRLTDAEFAVIRRHPADGAEMVAAVGDPDITAMVRHHHERLDGRGYPDGLAGSDIPLGARVIAVADTFDAISSSRAYHSAATHKRALDTISEAAGSQLDGALVAAFLQSYAARRSAAWSAGLAAAGARLLGWLQSSSSGLAIGSLQLAPILPALGVAGVLAASAAGHGDAVREHGKHAAARIASPAGAPVLPVLATGRPGRHRRTAGARTAPTASEHRLRRAPASPPSAGPAPRDTSSATVAPPASLAPTSSTTHGEAPGTPVSHTHTTSEGPSASSDPPSTPGAPLPAPPAGIPPVGPLPATPQPPAAPVSVPSAGTPPVASTPAVEVSADTPVGGVSVKLPELALPSGSG